MAKALKTLKFPGIAETYTVPVVDNTLSIEGAAADAKAVADAIQVIQGGGAIGNLPDMTGILPVAKGGTGVTTVDEIKNLLGPGNLPDMTGVLPIEKGGTGATSGKAAQYNLLHDMNSTSYDAVNGGFQFVGAYNTPNTTQGALYKIPATNLLPFIRVYSETEPTPVKDLIWLKPIN